MSKTKNKGKHILILGAGSDMAFAAIRLLYKKWENSHFYLLARKPDALQTIATEGIHNGHQVKIYPYDLENHADLHFTSIEYCLVYAGWLPPDNSEPDKAMQVNFRGIKTFIDKLVAENENSLQHIILTGSVAGVRVRPANKTYGEAKAALHQYAFDLQRKWKGVFATTLVIPGYVATKMISRHTTPAPLTLSTAQMAIKYVHWMETRPQVVYSQPVWKWISLLLRTMPEFLIKRMKK